MVGRCGIVGRDLAPAVCGFLRGVEGAAPYILIQGRIGSVGTGVPDRPRANIVRPYQPQSAP